MKIKSFSVNLQQFKDNLSKEVFGETVEEAQSEGECIRCKQPALARCHTEAGRREYQISGMCEDCFDQLFSEPEGGEEL